MNIAAGAEPFWKISRRLLESPRAMAREALDEGVVALGIPLDAYNALEAQGVGAEKVDADLMLAANLGMRASPTLFVNGIEIEGAPPVEALLATIGGALAQAQDQVTNGIDRVNVYDVVTGLNRSSPWASAIDESRASSRISNEQVIVDSSSPDGSVGGSACPIMLGVVSDRRNRAAPAAVTPAPQAVGSDSWPPS